MRCACGEQSALSGTSLLGVLIGRRGEEALGRGDEVAQGTHLAHGRFGPLETSAPRGLGLHVRGRWGLDDADYHLTPGRRLPVVLFSVLLQCLVLHRRLHHHVHVVEAGDVAQGLTRRQCGHHAGAGAQAGPHGEALELEEMHLPSQRGTRRGGPARPQPLLRAPR